MVSRPHKDVKDTLTGKDLMKFPTVSHWDSQLTFKSCYGIRPSWIMVFS